MLDCLVRGNEQRDAHVNAGRVDPKGARSPEARYRDAVTSPQPESPQILPGEVSGFGRRVVAIILDWVLSIVLSRVLFGQFEYGTPEASLSTLMIFVFQLILLTWLMSASFGQRIMRIAVVRMTGERLSLWRVTLRTALICLVIPAVVFDSDGRGLHDRLVGSVVIRRSR